MTKNFLNKNVFLCHNWDILPRNQLLLKNEMGFRMKNFDILGASLKSRIFRGGFPKNQHIGGLGQFPDLRRGLGKKEGVVFLWGRYPNAHYASFFAYPPFSDFF